MGENGYCTPCKYQTQLEQAFEEIKKNQKEHEKYEEALYSIRSHSDIVDERYNNIIVSISKMERQLEELVNKPVRRYDGIVTAIISAIIGGVITFIFIQLGMK